MTDTPRKRGRPKGTTKPAEERLQALSVRLGGSYRELLDQLCQERGESQREVLEAGLRLLQERMRERAVVA